MNITQYKDKWYMVEFNKEKNTCDLIEIVDFHSRLTVSKEKLNIVNYEGVHDFYCKTGVNPYILNDYKSHDIMISPQGEIFDSREANYYFYIVDGNFKVDNKQAVIELKKMGFIFMSYRDYWINDFEILSNTKMTKEQYLILKKWCEYYKLKLPKKYCKIKSIKKYINKLRF